MSRESARSTLATSFTSPFDWLYMKQPLRLDFLWPALCILGAVYFMFRGHTTA